MNYKKELLIKNIRGDFGKGIVIGTVSVFYFFFRLFNVLNNPMLFLDIFMLAIFLYSIYLILFKFIK